MSHTQVFGGVPIGPGHPRFRTTDAATTSAVVWSDITTGKTWASTVITRTGDDFPGSGDLVRWMETMLAQVNGHHRPAITKPELTFLGVKITNVP